MTHPVRTAALWIAALVIAGTTAFLGVALALRRDGEVPAPKARANSDVRRLETQAADLRALFDTITARRNTPFAADARPRVHEIQNTLLRTHLSGPAYDAALTAADRLAAYAANSSNPAVQSAAERALAELDGQLRADHRRK